MKTKYVVIMVWSNSELVSGISFNSEAEAWHEANELQALASKNNFNVVYSVRPLSEVC